MDTEETTRALVTLERAGWDALCGGTGSEFYGRTMTAEGVMILANGMSLGSEDVVASHWSTGAPLDGKAARTSWP